MFLEIHLKFMSEEKMKMHHSLEKIRLFNSIAALLLSFIEKLDSGKQNHGKERRY